MTRGACRATSTARTISGSQVWDGRVDDPVQRRVRGEGAGGAVVRRNLVLIIKDQQCYCATDGARRRAGAYKRLYRQVGALDATFSRRRAAVQ